MRTTARLIFLVAALLSSTSGAWAILNGTLYAVVAPVYDGSNGSTSYLRLFGGVGAATSTFTIRVVSTTTGAALGSALISVPKYASPQYSFATILSLTHATTAADHGYAFYIQNAESTSGYQHVTFNGTSNLFENASICAYPLNQSVAAAYPSLVVTNVHTDKLAAFPAEIDIHNYWNAASTFGVYVYDAGTADGATGAIRTDAGTLVGSKQYTIGANASLNLDFAKIEQDIGWATNASQFHANVIVTDITNQAPVEVINVAIVNTKLGGTINMSTTCAVNAPPATTKTGGGGAYLS